MAYCPPSHPQPLSLPRHCLCLSLLIPFSIRACENICLHLRAKIPRFLALLSHFPLLMSLSYIKTSDQVEESLDLRPGVRLWRAKFIDSDEMRNLMVYDLGSDPLHREELRQFYLREFKALNALQSTGLVPDMSDHFTWSEDFLVLPLKPLRGKALSAYSTPRTRDELVKELQVAAEVFRGLVTIHQQGIVHRALSPDVIHVVHDNQKTSVSFTNFYAARLSSSDRSIASPLDALTIDDPYAAPEIAYGYEFAQPASDVFSVGMIFLERGRKHP